MVLGCYNMRPGLSLGPFFLGMPITRAIAHIQEGRSEHHVVQVKYSNTSEVRRVL